MSWRYRKSVKIMPGVRLNFTNRGVSASVGPRGSSVSVSRRGTYLNQSFMGLSRRTRLGRGSAGATSALPAHPVLPREAEAWWATAASAAAARPGRSALVARRVLKSSQACPGSAWRAPGEPRTPAARLRAGP
jgi:hypothetical protein